MVDEARVTYRAIANFLDLTKKAAAARKDLEALGKTEAKVNKDSVEGSKKTAAAHRDATKAVRSRATSTKTLTAAILEHNKALKENISLTRSSGTAAQTAAAKVKVASMVTKDAASEVAKLAKEHTDAAAVESVAAAATDKVTNAAKKKAVAFKDMSKETHTATQRMGAYVKELFAVIPVSGRANNGLVNVLNTFRKIGNYRPHLIPPFVALVPIIGGLLALLNPLVSMLGAVGIAGFAAGSGIASMGGALIGIVPLVAAAIGGIAGLLVAFKGVGSVFSKYSQGKQALGKAGGGTAAKSAADEAWNNMKAQERLTDAQENAIDAQKDLNKARADAIKKLQQLSKAVKQNVLDENDAAASLQLATENYYNTMADPGSTLGDKMKATSDLAQAQQDLSDAQAKSVEDQEALNKAQAAGVDGDEDVISAQKNLRNATRSLRDAQHDLNESVAGGSGSAGAVGAMDDYETALNKLSPSARAVVLALIGMQGAWESVQRTVQEAFFSKIVNDMDDLASLLPTLENLLSKSAGAMGNLAHNFLMLVSSPAWKSDLDIISDQNVELIDLAGESVLNLLTALKDVVIAAGPFAKNLLTSFSKLTKSFSTIVADARSTGSLATWLDLVYTRIQQWWRIIKNVASTLFNYGAASSEFGKWITDGLEAMTEGWKKNSEAAREDGSPFKLWLEDIKPLLSNIKGLFGDFFSWFGKTAMNEDTLKHADDIVSTIRDDLGPALADIFDALDDSGIGEAFISTLSSIIESIATIVENGGAEGFKNFFTVVEGFFKLIADLAASSGGKWFVSSLIPALGVLAAITFVGKFSGLFTLFGWLSTLAGNGKVLTLLTKLGNLKNLKNISAPTAIGAGAVGTGAVAGAAGVAGNIGDVTRPGLSDAFDKYYTGTKEEKKESIVEISDRAAGMILPPGLRGALETLAPDLYKNITDTISGMTQGYLTFMSELGGNIGTFFSGTGAFVQDSWANVTTGFNTISTNIDFLWQTMVVTPFNNVIAGIQLLWQQYVVSPFNVAVSTIKSAWQQYVVNPFNAVSAAISSAWTTYVVNPFNVVSAAISSAWTTYVVNPFKLVGTVIQTGWKTYVTDPFNAVSKTIQTGWDGVVKFFKDFNIGKIFGGGDTSASDTRGAGGGPAMERVKSVLPKSLGITSSYRTPAQNQAVGGVPGSLHTDKKNPAVDIAGPVGAMDSFAAVLRKMGGWRQLLYRVPGHYDHIHVAHQGGEVSNSWPRSPGDKSNERTTRLQVGEVVVPKSVAQNPFSGAALAGSPVGVGAITGTSSAIVGAQAAVDNSTNFGDINIYNAKPEPASDSLPAAIRKVSQVGGRRKPNPRLETEV
jgi:hypothetical protein